MNDGMTNRDFRTALMPAGTNHDQMIQAFKSMWLNPSALIEDALGQPVNHMHLFVYLYRRFGEPNLPTGDTTTIAEYALRWTKRCTRLWLIWQHQ